METIGENIKRLRERSGYTQVELARLIGVHEKYVSAIERGKNTPSASRVEKLCLAFGVSERELRFGEPDEHGLDLRYGTVIRMLVDELSHLQEIEQLEWLLRIRKDLEAKKQAQGDGR